LHSLWPEVFDAYTPDDVERLDIDALPQLLHTLVRWDRVGLAVAGPGAFPALDTLASAEPSPIDNDAVVIAPGEDPPHADETHAGGNIVRLTDSRAAHTALRLGWRVPGRAHPHYTPLQMASLVLGGYFNSALTRRIRTDEALAYAPRALLDPLWEEAAFLIEVDTQSDKLIRCLTIIDEETAALIRPTPAQADALGHARRYALGTLALMLSSNAGVASTLATLLTSDLPATWLDTYASALQAVSVGDLAEAAKRHLDPSQRHGCAIGEPDRSADSPERVLEE
jgi:predicted Zn-dependent peptidase